MRVYAKEQKSVFKWILAIVIFVLAMTITFDEVEGIGVPPTDRTISNTDHGQKDVKDYDFKPADDTDANRQQDNNNLTPVPEPTTIILLAAGLGAISLLNRRKEKV